MSGNAEFEKSLLITKFALKLSGIDFDSLQRPNLLFHFRECWLYVFCTLWMQSVVFGEICFTWCAANSVKARELLSVLIFMMPGIVLGVLGTVKTAYLLFHSGTMHQIIQELRVMFRGNSQYQDSEITSNDVKEEKIVKNCMDLVRNVVSALFWVYSILITISNFRPLYVLVFKLIIVGELEFTLPVPSKYPFDPCANGIIWPIAYVHQNWACIVAVMNIIGADTLFFVCCTHVFMHFCLLRHRMEVLDGDDLGQLHGNLDALVLRHQKLIRLVDMLETTFSKPIFIDCLTSTFLICLNLFNATNLKDAWSIILFIAFLFSNVSQIFLICLFGDMLSNSSVAVADGLYHSKWYTITPKTRKRILFIITRSQKPCRLTAAKYTDINLKTFTTILSRSWSFFAVLNTMSSD